MNRTAPWTCHVLTLFPEMFPGPLAFSLAGRALDAGVWKLAVTDIRDFATGKHRSVDDTPFGGGPGMVMRADVLAAALDGLPGKAPGGAAALSGKSGAPKASRNWGAPGETPLPAICFTPRGRRMDQELAREIAGAEGAILVCGRFEGVDQRVVEARGLIEISLGDFVLSGGEIAALALIDAAVRLLPGVVGDANSLAEESFTGGLLEYPHFTRPRVWEGREVPDVLLGGDHAAIAAWRRRAAEELTRARRPDLWRNRAPDSRTRAAMPPVANQTAKVPS
jgi:tRNA (guanine37-N1)-methyltransferase